MDLASDCCLALALYRYESSDHADLDLGNYGEIEAGKRPGMRVVTLYRLCQVLRISADDLLGLPQKEEECVC